MATGNGTTTKIVWLEGSIAHCVIGTMVSEDAHFMVFRQRDGSEIKLNKNFVIKIEAVRA